MDDKYMGRRCQFISECHVFQGKVKFKLPLFVVKNIYCNNGPRWWSRCHVYENFISDDKQDLSIIPSEDLRPE
ncbi:MAG: hypothetical protein ACERKD_09560 [Prolixibacteraceae bacterium]